MNGYIEAKKKGGIKCTKFHIIRNRNLARDAVCTSNEA
jgi:hypothetical protein